MIAPAETTRQTVPNDWETRLKIRVAARAHIKKEKLVPPQTLQLLQTHTQQCLLELQLTGAGFEDFTTVMLNNALWEPYLAGIPTDQRLLLLPLCLRNQSQCSAPSDELGLICNECGGCTIPHLSEQAEELGMPVLVAESSSRVVDWVESGEIQAVIGVSCMESLRKAFPSMFRFAIPGIAVPLTKDGCKDTTFDLPFLHDSLAINVDENHAKHRPVPYDKINEHLKSLFSTTEIEKYLAAKTPHLTEFPREISHVLCSHGKHYRPMITFGSFCALSVRDDFPDFLNPIALAVECFHKASLVHDDIEDEDATRYDEPTLHKRIGIPEALNIGDFLIGEGYRLLGHSAISIELRSELMIQAAQAHCELSLGQAQEFELRGKKITLEQCLETHRLKTAPAFRVSLYMGAIAAEAFEKYRDVFHEFADMFGISYQLHDDLEDVAANPASAVDCLMLSKNVSREDARHEITSLYETYRTKTYEVLENVDDTTLKIFMYHLIGKVLEDV